MIKKNHWILGFIVVFLNAGLALEQRSGGSQLGAITVSGLGEVQVVPDVVSMTLGIEARERELSPALYQADECVRRVIEIATKLGVEKQKIQTDHIRIDPSYWSGGEKRKIQFFVVQRNISLVLNEIGKYDQLIKNCIEAGINRVSNVQFRIEDESKLKEQARKLAIKEAMLKATAMADCLELKIGKAVSVVEGSAGQSWQGNDQLLVASVASGVQADRERMAGSTYYVDGIGGPGSMALGHITVRASVIIRFELQ